MTCAEYRRWFSPYVDEVLEVPLRSQLEGHVSQCGACKHELDALKQMLQTLRSMDQPVSPDLVPGVRAKLSRAPWWRAIAERFMAPWPISLPVHGLALTATAVLAIVIANVPGMLRRDRLAGAPMKVASANQPVDRTLKKEAAMLSTLEEENMRLKDRDVVVRMDGKMVATQKGVERNITDELASRRADSPASVGAIARLEQRPLANESVSEDKGRLFEGLRLNEANMAPAAVAAPNILADREPGDALVIQASWDVQDLAAAAAQATEWAQAHEGTVVVTNDRQLFVTLRAIHVVEFLGKFSTRVPNAPASTTSPWVNISLELVPQQ